MDFKTTELLSEGMGKDQSNNFYINDAYTGTERVGVKIDYQNEDIHLRGNVIVPDDSIMAPDALIVNAGNMLCLQVQMIIITFQYRTIHGDND